jgi:hypothetical protein
LRHSRLPHEWPNAGLFAWFERRLRRSVAEAQPRQFARTAGSRFREHGRIRFGGRQGPDAAAAFPVGVMLITHGKGYYHVLLHCRHLVDTRHRRPLTSSASGLTGLAVGRRRTWRKGKDSRSHSVRVRSALATGSFPAATPLLNHRVEHYTAFVVANLAVHRREYQFQVQPTGRLRKSTENR